MLTASSRAGRLFDVFIQELIVASLVGFTVPTGWVAAALSKAREEEEGK